MKNQQNLYRYFASGILIFLLLVAVLLRTIGLEKVPPSPYWEEVALGYDAYSISKTGADHHGTFLPSIAFESFGDWKPSLYFYAIVPFIALFDLSVLSVRLPAALAGSVLVGMSGYLSYYLAKEIWPKNKKIHFFAVLLGITSATFSPWLIMFSRGGWEVMLGTTLIFGGLIAGIQVVTTINSNTKQNIKIQPHFLLLCVFLLALAMYAYHGTRMLAPLYGLSLLAWWYFVITKAKGTKTLQWISQELFSTKNRAWIFFSVLLLFALSSPFITSFGSPQLQQRFLETSIFSSSDAVLKSNNLRELHNYSLLSRIAYHRYWFYLHDVLINYFKHFSLSFLFISGDTNPRHSVQFVGQLYLIELLPLLIGTGYIAYRAKIVRVLFFALLGLSVLPAAISQAAPHALRTLPLAPLLLASISIGWIGLALYVTKICKQFFTSAFFAKGSTALVFLALFFIYSLSVFQFIHYYWTIYPSKQAHEWQYGYEQVIESLVRLQSEYPKAKTLISREFGRPAMYYWFYTKTDPTLVQQASQNLSNSKKDQSELLEFQTIFFVDTEQALYEQLVQDDQTYTIVAGSPKYVTKTLEYAQSQNKPYQIVETQSVQDKKGAPVWNILLIKNN